MYFGKISNTEKINSELLRLADKYGIFGLVELCTNHLRENVNLENVLDILIAAHQTNQKGLFAITASFVYR